MKSPRLPISRRSSAFTSLLALSAAAFTPAVIQAQTIFIDFGSGGTGNPTASAGWNNVVSGAATPAPVSLLDFETGLASSISYQITDAFLTTATNGAQLEVGEFPVSATRDSVYGDNSNPTAAITFSGFDPSKQYTFTFLASRSGSSDNRATLFTLTGMETSSVTVDAALATPVPGSIFSISPSVSGTFTLDVSKHPTLNTNSSGFYYLNAIKIEVAQIPEPSSAAVLAGAAAVTLVGLRRRRD